MSESSTWLVLGASSAIGRAIAEAAARRGSDVILAGRNLDELERTAAHIRITSGRKASTAPFDALAFDTHQYFANEIAGRTGELNVALLFALMPEQAEMDSDPAKALACIAASYMGAVSVLHHLAPHLEAKGRGVVIGFGSVAGDRGRLKNYIYGSSKAGLHAYLSGLRNRLGRRGVHVMTVKPGFVDTAMTWGKPGVVLAARPEVVAEACLRAGEKRKDVIYVPGFWRWVMLVIRLIPESIFKKLSI
jgi:short-subunit dehydrogenase